MNPWDILGIKETSNRKAIKRAYANLIKKHHPEDDPEAFQRIRNAYEEVLQQIDYIKFDDSDFGSDQSNTAPEINFEKNNRSYDNPHIRESSNQQENLDSHTDYRTLSNEILEKAKELCTKEPDRNIPQKWTALLENDLLWNIEAKKYFSDQLFKHIADLRINSFKKLWLPKDVWYTIEAHMNWLHQEMRLYQMYPDDMVNTVLDPIRTAIGKARSTDMNEHHKLADRLMDNTRPSYAFLCRIILIIILILINHRFFCK